MTAYDPAAKENQYPKMKYHKDAGDSKVEKAGLYSVTSKVVHDSKEEGQLGAGWFDTPEEAEGKKKPGNKLSGDK